MIINLYLKPVSSTHLVLTKHSFIWLQQQKDTPKAVCGWKDNKWEYYAKSLDHALNLIPDVVTVLDRSIASTPEGTTHIYAMCGEPSYFFRQVEGKNIKLWTTMDDWIETSFYDIDRLVTFLVGSQTTTQEEPMESEEYPEGATHILLNSPKYPADNNSFYKLEQGQLSIWSDSRWKPSVFSTIEETVDQTEPHGYRMVALNTVKPAFTPKSAQYFCNAALEHMEERAATYDNPEGERSMGKTVEAFNAITGHTLTEEQGWMFMVLLKLVRSQQGNHKNDNYEDALAYVSLMGETASKERGCEK